jgi:hypothetical protein
MRKLSVLAVAALVVLGLSATARAENSIKDVMKKAHQGKPALCAKCASGKATKEEKEELVALYEDLAKAEPPKGEKDSWKMKTEALLKAAKGMAKDDKTAIAAYKKALDCKVCHTAHK